MGLVPPLLSHQVDGGLDSISPVRPSVALDGDVISRSKLQISRLARGHGMPRAKFGEKLNVLEDLFVERHRHVRQLICRSVDWYL